jgi:oligoribonuclease
MNNESRFLWIDLEMTGLDASKDVILEIASLITDTQLNIIAEGPHHVIHQPEHLLDSMIPIVRTMHTQSGLVDLVRASTITIEQAAQETYAFLKKNSERRKVFLAGNSVWMDRTFLERYMPKITGFIHYRLIDVSSLKVLTQSWYPQQTAKTGDEKKGTHRALDDIKESLAELKQYRTQFFK